MENLGSWIWIILAIFWLGAKILPRLFRRGGSQTEVPVSQPAIEPIAEPTPSDEPLELDEGPVTDFDTLISSLNKTRFAPQNKSEAPPPIEPK